MKRICVDMDDVMADALSEHLRRYNERFGERITREDLHGKDLWDIAPVERHKAITEIFHTEGFFEDLPVMPGAQEVLRELSQHYEIFVATAAMTIPSSFSSKYRWLQRHFSFLPPTHYVFLGHKHVLRADFLIDDLPRNLRSFDGTGILFSAPHNRLVHEFARVENWHQVPELLTALSGTI